jgi:DNA-binding LacI/PurR family transcriptional regulator
MSQARVETGDGLPPLRIGILDENGNDEYHGIMLSGIFEAAGRHGAEVIRVGHFLSNDTTRDPAQVQHLLHYVRQFRLDGLIFLGWARVCSYGNEALFRSMLSHLPLFSMGMGRADMPSALFDGDPYLEELLLHLILGHSYRRIAFIAPFNPDGRAAV